MARVVGARADSRRGALARNQPCRVPSGRSAHRMGSKVVYGERLWLTGRDRVPAAYRAVIRWMIAAALAGFCFIAWGLGKLEVWPTIYGATLVVFAQLWRIDRMSLLYDEMQAERPSDDKMRG